MVDEINKYVLDQLPGEETSLFAVDCITQEDSTGAVDRQMPAEYLQSLNPPGLPPSILELKVGMPVMILRNISAERGLCNGTRVTVLSIGEFLLKIKLPNVDGRIEVISRFTLSTLENEYPFTLTRKQFSVRRSFAMTINKSQGQSLKIVGIGLRSPVFTHGQLYVALS
ncbi:ATP-dependent DNA helicase PIF1, partial [Choanephora cucurbitarum]